MDEKDAALFNDIYKEIVNTLGVEAAIKIFNMYKGQQVTFPVHLYSTKRIKNSIVCEYNGYNIKELSKKYDYSEKTIRRIIKDINK